MVKYHFLLLNIFILGILNISYSQDIKTLGVNEEIKCINGHFCKITLNKDSILSLFWGNETITREYEHSSNRDFGYSTLIFSDYKDFICLSQSCGYQCGYYEFFPVDKSATTFVLHNVLNAIPEKNIVVYMNSEDNFDPKITPKNDTLLTVMNLVTKKRQNINLDKICFATNQMNNIEEIKFVGNELFVQWNYCKNGQENPIVKKQKFKITVF